MDQCLLLGLRYQYVVYRLVTECDANSFPCSETTFPSDSSVQVNAAVWSRYERSRREMGVQSVVVFPYPVRLAARLQFHIG